MGVNAMHRGRLQRLEELGMGDNRAARPIDGGCCRYASGWSGAWVGFPKRVEDGKPDVLVP